MQLLNVARMSLSQFSFRPDPHTAPDCPDSTYTATTASTSEPSDPASETSPTQRHSAVPRSRTTPDHSYGPAPSHCTCKAAHSRTKRTRRRRDSNGSPPPPCRWKRSPPGCYPDGPSGSNGTSRQTARHSPHPSKAVSDCRSHRSHCLRNRSWRSCSLSCAPSAASCRRRNISKRPCCRSRT